MKLNRELIMWIWFTVRPATANIKPGTSRTKGETHCAPDPPVKPSVAPKQTKWGRIACSQIWRKHLPPGARERQNDSTRQNDLNFLPKKTLLMKWCVLRGDGPSALAPLFIKQIFLLSGQCVRLVGIKYTPATCSAPLHCGAVCLWLWKARSAPLAATADRQSPGANANESEVWKW